MTLHQIVFIHILAVAFGVFGWTLRRFYRVIAVGKTDLTRDEIRKRLTGRIIDILKFFFGQRSVAREPSSYHHMFIFWGFLVIAVGTGEILINGAIPAFSYEAVFGHTLNNAFKLLLDVTNLAILGLMAYAIYRRIVKKPNLIPMNFDAALILGMISTLALSHFLAHGFHFIATLGANAHFLLPADGPSADPSWMPISGRLVPALFGSIHAHTAHTISSINYWLHVSIVLFFLNYIPYSKHLHLLGAFPNIFLRNTNQAGVMPKLDLEDETQWGVARYEQFGWKSLLDSYACTECARCTNNCPAYNTGKPLSPMHLVHDIKHEMFDRGELLVQLTEGARKAIDAGDPLGEEDEAVVTDRDKEILAELAEQPALIGGRIKEETLWACTTCGQCEDICPVFIRHPMKILELRTNLVLEQGNQPPEWARMFRGLENNQNPWGVGSDQRMEWAKRYDIPVMADLKEAGHKPDYLLWIGCAGSFDDRGQKIARDWVALLQQAGVDFGVLGEEEGCTGDAARRAGNEFLFQMLAEQNIETFAEYDVKKILVACPHCYHSFKNEYPALGGNYEVIHHSQFIPQLIAEGKLEPKNEVSKDITFHDPCYLGRWNKEYDAPRETLKAVTGSAPLEMPRTREKSFCCGAGGAKLWAEEETPYINVNRTQEAIDTGASIIGTACPFCNSMLVDGLKNLDKDEDVEVLDIAQVVAKATGATIRLKEAKNVDG